MIRPLTLLTAAALICGCTETRVIKDNSPNSKFASLFGGQAVAGGEATGGWQVTRNDIPQKPISPQAQRMAELMRAQMNSPAPSLSIPDNPGGWRVTTSFPNSDQPANEKSPGPATRPVSTPAMPNSPWGVAPVTPLPTTPAAQPATPLPNR